MANFVRESKNKPGDGALKYHGNCPEDCTHKERIPGYKYEYICDFVYSCIGGQECKHAYVKSHEMSAYELISAIIEEREKVVEYFGNHGKRVGELLDRTIEDWYEALEDDENNS